MSESLNPSFNQFVQITDAFIYKTQLCVSQRRKNSSAVPLFGTLFIVEIQLKQELLCLKCKPLNINFLFTELFIKSVSHL